MAWVIGDLAPHPVSRFIYQFFAGSQQHSFAHDHLLVNTFDYGKESCKDWFQDLSNLSIVDVSMHQAEKRVAAIRDLGADIAIDLGWTSNHFLAGFMARLAPIQVEYLGYFASGLDEMDYWLGDHNLSPPHAGMEFGRFSFDHFSPEAHCPSPKAQVRVSEGHWTCRFGSLITIARCRIRQLPFGAGSFRKFLTQFWCLG